MKNSILLLLLGFLAACQSCTSQPSPQPPVVTSDTGGTGSVMADAAPAYPSRIAQACDNLSTIGCLEGGPQCVRVLTHLEETGLESSDIDCYIFAKDKTSARVCAHVECP